MKQIIDIFAWWLMAVIPEGTSISEYLFEQDWTSPIEYFWEAIAPAPEYDHRDDRFAEELGIAFDRGLGSRAIVRDRTQLLRGGAK